MADFLAFDDLKSRVAWQSALAELIATLLFIFLGAGAVVGTAIVGGDALSTERLTAIAMAHGLAIAVLVAATAHLSGGHINPAVTISAMFTQKIGLTKGVMYIIAQLTGAAAGAYLLQFVLPATYEGNLGAHALSVDIGPGILLEMVLTFALVFVIFATAMDSRGPTHLAPFVIGITVFVDHFIGVPLTGASMNPARSFGPALAAGQWTDHWVYWVGPIFGGVIAASLYELVYARGHQKDA